MEHSTEGATSDIATANNADIIELSGTPMESRVHVTEQQDDLSRRTLIKLIAAGFSFFVAGVNDGSLGALIPYVIRVHGISTAVLSSVYAASFFGWLTAALTNTQLSQKLDLGAMLIFGCVLQISAQALRLWPAHFGLYVFTFWLTSVGQAYQDTHANTYVAGAARGAHKWLGFIHAMYMAGCLVGPFVASPIASSGSQSPWYLFYTVPLGLGVVNVLLVWTAFHDSVGLIPKRPPLEPDNVEEGTRAEPGSAQRPQKGATTLILETFHQSGFWLLSVFFFFYLGAVITASGWVVEFLVDVRHGDLTTMGYVPAGYSGGSLLGRLLLPEPTRRFGERFMVSIYCAICIGFQLVFWLVPNIVAASVAISFVGFFSGPLFATGISVGSRLFPADIRSTALSLVFVFAQVGGSLFPIVTGQLSAHVGVWTLQPMLAGLLGATAVSWLLVPRPSSCNVELHRE